MKKNIMYMLYGPEARKKEGAMEDRLESPNNQKTENVFCTGQPTKQILCTKCKGKGIKPATMTGIASYGSPDQRYICEDCGYIGSLILDVSEQEKSESDIEVENDFKKELGLDGERTDNKVPIQIKSILKKGICYTESEVPPLRFTKWHKMCGTLTILGSGLYKFAGYDFEEFPQEISFEPEAIYIDEENKEIAFTIHGDAYRVLWFEIGENFESVNETIKSGLIEIDEEEFKKQIIEYNIKKRGLLSVLYWSVGCFIAVLCAFHIIHLYFSLTGLSRVPYKEVIPFILNMSTVFSILILIIGLFDYMKMLHENKKIKEGDDEWEDRLFRYHDEYDDVDDGGCGCE